MDIIHAIALGKAIKLKVALVAPDGLSALIFFKTFVSVLKKDYQANIVTISSVDMYLEDLKKIQSTHYDLPMARWLSPLQDLVYMIRLWYIFRVGNFDHVITFTTKPNIYGVIAAKLAGVKNITMAIRGLGQTFNKGRGFKHRILQALVKQLYSVACSRCNNVWFTNKNDLEYFLTTRVVTSEQAFLTNNAVDLSQFSQKKVSKSKVNRLYQELAICPEDQVIVMVARLIWSKGVREFVEAAISLYPKFPRAHFLLVAPMEKGSAEAVPECFVRNGELKSNLKWLGFRKDVLELYFISDLSVLPSYYKEGGYPRALLEAMALGKPVIAANTEDCKGPVEDGSNGYLVEPKDTQSLVNAIDAILSNEPLKSSFGLRSIEIMNLKFDDRIVVKEALYNIFKN